MLSFVSNHPTNEGQSERKKREQGSLAHEENSNLAFLIKPTIEGNLQFGIFLQQIRWMTGKQED